MRYKLKHQFGLKEKEMIITKQEVVNMYNQLQDKEVSGFVFGFEKVV